jgi:YD repeat-containing protein
MLTATDSIGSITYIYDPLDRLTGKTDPGSLNQAYALDNVGNRLTLQDPDGGVRSMVYDLQNRLVSVMEDDGMIATWSYDPLNRCTTLQQANPGLTITWGFDPRSSVLTVFHSDASGNVDQAFTYVYDAVTNRAAASDILAL